MNKEVRGKEKHSTFVLLSFLFLLFLTGNDTYRLWLRYFLFLTRMCFSSAFRLWVPPRLKTSVPSGTLRWDTIVPTLPSSWWVLSWIWEMTRTPWRSWRRRNSLQLHIPKDWQWPRRLVPSSTWSAQPWLSVALKLCSTRPSGPSSALHPSRRRGRSALSSKTSSTGETVTGEHDR